MKSPVVEQDEIICQCFQVKESVIRAAIEANNLTRIEQVTKSCEAGGGCHSCHILIQLFIDQHRHLTHPMEELVSEHAKKVSKKGILSRFFAKMAGNGNQH